MDKKTVIDFALPTTVAVFLTAVLVLTDADIGIEHWFYSPDAGWFLGRQHPWRFLYEFGNVPALLLSFGGLAVFVLGFFRRALIPYRRAGLFLVVFMVLGPGLLVNTLLKDHWGRPRPIDTVNFGGSEPFRHAWDKGQAGQGKSFPSGHAAVGFFVFAPFFFLRKTHRGWAVFFLCMGMAYGLLMGVGRMVQGGHYPTDVLWSGAFTYLTGLVLYYLFGFHRQSQSSEDS